MSGDDQTTASSRRSTATPAAQQRTRDAGTDAAAASAVEATSTTDEAVLGSAAVLTCECSHARVSPHKPPPLDPHGLAEFPSDSPLPFAPHLRLLWRALQQQPGFKPLPLSPHLAFREGAGRGAGRRGGRSGDGRGGGEGGSGGGRGEGERGRGGGEQGEGGARGGEEERPGVRNWLVETAVLRRVRVSYVDCGAKVQALTALCYPRFRRSLLSATLASGVCCCQLQVCNVSHPSPSRRVRVSYVDCGAKVQALTALCYPRFRCDLPLLAVELLCFNSSRLLAFVDLHPTSPHQLHRLTQGNLLPPTVTTRLNTVRPQHAHLLTPMTARFFASDSHFFSPHLLLYRSQDGWADANLQLDTACYSLFLALLLPPPAALPLTGRVGRCQPPVALLPPRTCCFTTAHSTGGWADANLQYATLPVPRHPPALLVTPFISSPSTSQPTTTPAWSLPLCSLNPPSPSRLPPSQPPTGSVWQLLTEYITAYHDACMACHGGAAPPTQAECHAAEEGQRAFDEYFERHDPAVNMLGQLFGEQVSLVGEVRLFGEEVRLLCCRCWGMSGEEVRAFNEYFEQHDPAVNMLGQLFGEKPSSPSPSSVAAPIPLFSLHCSPHSLTLKFTLNRSPSLTFSLLPPSYPSPPLQWTQAYTNRFLFPLAAPRRSTAPPPSSPSFLSVSASPIPPSSSHSL
ncbi:unnamed protein product [Closterium sp. NIES-64]|nr:unnamed protein product [Closterium sp. NIES-64]